MYPWGPEKCDGAPITGATGIYNTYNRSSGNQTYILCKIHNALK